MSNENATVNLIDETVAVAGELQTGPVGFADIAAILDVMQVQEQPVKELQFKTLTSAYSGQLTNGDHFSAVIKAVETGEASSAVFVGEEPNDFGTLINDKCNGMLQSFMGTVTEE